ncbi:MAG: hypothetical protein IPM21_05835 [Acidobacteria bacterium]|nr:hypothetical protein [Acidobacteriota bacterium]
MTKGVLAIVSALFTFAVLQVGTASAATLTVNENSAGVTCNQTLSLAEAAEFARDGTSLRNLTDGEKAQISGVIWLAFPPEPNCAGAIWRAAVNGGVGKFVTDSIFFSNAVTQINDHVFLGRDDRIYGLKPNGSKVILDGTGNGNDGITFFSFDDGLRSTTNSQVSNLVIRNFQRSGISAGYVRGSVFEGLEIYGNGRHGIALLGSAEGNARTVRIGGTLIAQRNFIYSNNLDGISIIGDPVNDRSGLQNIEILNNYIGTSNGTTENGNNGNGIYLEHTFGVIIGDATGATRNVISGNNGDGVKIVGSQSFANEVFGNFIGTDASGGAALGNSASGVALLSAAGSAVDLVSKTPNLIGKPGFGNVISANNFGVFIADNNTSKNWIQSNRIGTNNGGNADLGNSLDGVLVGGGTSDNRIGGTGANEGNLIAFNRRGIFADGGIRNSFRRNRIFSNDELGIDLAPVGVTPNDTGDGDSGPNGLLNYPVITFVNAQNSVVYFEGTYNSAPNQSYTLEFFGNTALDASGFGEGRNFLGQTVVVTDGSGNANFSVEFAAPIADTGTWVTATATDSNNNTSEFSQGRGICSLIRLSPVGLLASASGGTSSFTVIQSVGCGGFTPVANQAWISVTGSSAGTVNFSVASNSGAQRAGAISVNFSNGQFFTFVNFNITQLAPGCSYSLSPTSANAGSSGGNGSISLTTTAGCNWTAVSSAPWLTITGGSSGSGSGTISYSVQANSGPARSATITAGGQTFTINQASGCLFFINPLNRSLSSAGGTGTFNVTSSNSGCTRSAASNVPWIVITGGSSGSGSGVISYTVSANTAGNPRTGTITVMSATFKVNQAAATKPQFDFDGDGRTDASIYRPSVGQWWYLRSSDGTSRAFQFGSSTDRIVPADYTGDGKTDIAYYVPSTSNWFILRSEDNTFYGYQFGLPGDVPAPGDFDGDGKADTAVFRPSNGVWYILRSSDNDVATVPFGVAGDVPAIADYDGDGKDDIAVWRPSNGTWWMIRSSNSSVFATVFGESTDKPVVGNYTGDGKADIAYFRPSNSTWYVLRSEDLSFYGAPWGQNGDIPVPGDYDGDGKHDLAVWRPGNNVWYLNRSGGTLDFVTFGQAGDKPVPTAWIP